MNIGMGVAAKFSRSSAKQWGEWLGPLFTGSDLVFGNLEAPLILDGGKAASGTFAGDAAFADVLSAMDMDVVSIANNHILEQGLDGFESTLRILKDNRINATGLCDARGSNIVVKELQGLSVGFASFCAINNIPNAGLYAEYKEENVLDCITQMNDLNVDVKVIALHWGDEFCRRPSLQQIAAAHRFIDAGADVIAGHHPHVIQPVEKYNGGLVFYSLGNFVFDMVWSRHVRDGLLATVTVSKQGVVGYDLQVVRIDKKDYLPKIVPAPRLLMRIDGFRVNDPERYERRYDSRKKREMLWHRVMMKKCLLGNWSKLPTETRAKLIKNFKIKR